MLRSVAAPHSGTARRNFELLKQNPNHPSLQFKNVGRYYSVRVGLRYRALGVVVPEGIQWFWVGSHFEYANLSAIEFKFEPHDSVAMKRTP